MSTNGWVRRALARQSVQRGRVVTEEPDEKLVVVVKFGLAMTLCFSGLELAHILLLGSWNSEIFASISGLAGTLSGIFACKKVFSGVFAA